MVYPAGGPAKSNTLHGSLLRVLTGPPSCSPHQGRPQVFLAGLVPLSPWWAEGPPLLFSFAFGEGALWVPGGGPHLRMALPPPPGRLHAFTACIGSETCPIYQGIYSTGSCHYDGRGISIRYSPLPGSTSQCPALVSGQLLKPTCGLPWPPGGPHHASSSSHRTGTNLPTG